MAKARTRPQSENKRDKQDKQIDRIIQQANRYLANSRNKQNITQVVENKNKTPNGIEKKIDLSKVVEEQKDKMEKAYSEKPKNKRAVSLRNLRQSDQPLEEQKIAKDLENQILYSVDIGQKDSSVQESELMHNQSKQDRDAQKDDGLFCGCKEYEVRI